MKVKVLTKSPLKTKKFRITDAQTGKKVDFGAKGYSDYTVHKDPFRMREYVRRHGGKIPRGVWVSASPQNVQNAMLRVKKSAKESWTDPDTPGFWSRWLLWSFPDQKKAIKFIKNRFGITTVTT
jgi:hypothetical protein